MTVKKTSLQVDSELWKEAKITANRVHVCLQEFLDMALKHEIARSGRRTHAKPINSHSRAVIGPNYKIALLES